MKLGLMFFSDVAWSGESSDVVHQFLLEQQLFVTNATGLQHWSLTFDLTKAEPMWDKHTQTIFLSLLAKKAAVTQFTSPVQWSQHQDVTTHTSYY